MAGTKCNPGSVIPIPLPCAEISILRAVSCTENLGVKVLLVVSLVGGGQYDFIPKNQLSYVQWVLPITIVHKLLFL